MSDHLMKRFEQLSQGHENRKTVATNRIVNHIKEYSSYVGLEFSNKECDQVALLSNEPDGSGNLRFTLCDQKGWFCHTTCKTVDILVRRLVEDGYSYPKVGIIDAWSESNIWKAGTEKAAVKMQMESGALSWNQMLDSFSEINTKYNLI